MPVHTKITQEHGSFSCACPCIAILHPINLNGQQNAQKVVALLLKNAPGEEPVADM